MDKVETDIEKIMQCHRGKEHAIPVPMLAALVHVGVRELQHIVRALRLQGVPIGTSHQPPHGYYLCQTQDEFDDMQRMFHDQGMSFLAVASRTFSPRNGAYRELVGQLSLFGEKPEPARQRHKGANHAVG